MFHDNAGSWDGRKGDSALVFVICRIDAILLFRRSHA